MNRVYCLYRVSDRGQVEKNDIPMQRIACQTFARERGWEILREFSEKGVSGYKLTMQQRDAVMEIREAAMAGKFDILLVYMFDRIGRRDDETPFVVEWLVRSGISVWSVCEGEQRFDTHVDKLTNYIRYWQAAGESEKISERTRTRIRQLTEEGCFTGGMCPYGYELVRGERLNKKKQPLCDLRICEEEAQVVRIMFDKAVREGLGCQRIAKYLNSQGFHTRDGKRWNPASITHKLSNRLYLGYLEKGGTQSPRLPHLQIVEDAIFAQVQELKKSRKRKETDMSTISAPRHGKALLSGLTYCGHCGARMNSTIHRKQYRRKRDGSLYKRDVRLYRCNASIHGEPVACDGPRTYHAERIEAAVRTSVSSLLEQLEALPAETILEYKYQIVLQQRREAYQTAQQHLYEKERDRETLRGEVARSIRGESSFGVPLLQELLQGTEMEIDKTREQLYALEAKLQNGEQLRREIEIKQRKYCGLNRIFRSGTLEEQKMLLAIVVQRIEVRRDYELHVQLSPDFERFLDGLIEMR